MNKNLLAKLKETNLLIPGYIDHLKKDKLNRPLCPLCNRPLTYIPGVNHIECEYCKDKQGKRLIRGYISLLMYNENLDFRTARRKAFNDLDLFKTSDKADRVKDYKKDIDIREKGVIYYNNRYNVREFYRNDPINKPLIFTDQEIGDLIYTELFKAYGDFLKTPNTIGIYNSNYTYNAFSVLLKAKKNHHLKIFLIFENSKEGYLIKRNLLNHLKQYDFNNYVIIDNLIDLDKGERTINDHYKNNKETFNLYLKNEIIDKFNQLFKKSDLESDNKLSNKDNLKTLKTSLNA